MDMTVSMSLDVPAIEGMLARDELAILKRHQVEIVKEIKAKWTGWKYEGRSPESVGRSRAAWKGRVQGTRPPFELVISNMARGYYSDKPYTAFVRRRMGAEPEHVIIYKWLVFERLPRLERELAEAITRNIGTPRPMKALRSTGGGRKSVTLT